MDKTHDFYNNDKQGEEMLESFGEDDVITYSPPKKGKPKKVE